MNINILKCYFIRLSWFILSPSFITLFCWTFFILYRIYCEPVLLCDDNGYSLYELKRSLIQEIANFRVANVEHLLYEDLQEQERQFSIKVRTTDLDREEEITENLKNSVTKMRESLSKIEKLETSIKKLEPNFKFRMEFKSLPNENND
jgi:hypothetical protein